MADGTEIVKRLLEVLAPRFAYSRLQQEFLQGFIGGLDVAIETPEWGSRIREAWLAMPVGPYKPFPSEVAEWIATGEHSPPEHL